MYVSVFVKTNLGGDGVKILEIISDMNIGGAGRVLLERLEKSLVEGEETIVLLPKNSALKARFENAKIKVLEFDGCADRSFDIGAIFKLKGIIRALSPDVVNTHGCLSARIAATLARVPVRIYTRHCTYPVPRILSSFPVKQVLGMIGVLLSPHAIAVADAAEEDLVSMGYPRERIRVIINGVGGFQRFSDEKTAELRRMARLDGKFVVGISARVEKCKGHECFVRAAKLLSADDRYRFVIMGTGSELENIKALATELGIYDKIIFTGFCENVEHWLNCFDLNVNCSVGTETSSLALSEGMSIGLPAVASNYGGNTYMVRHGENGFIYEKGNFRELAKSISEIADSPELYSKMSDAAYRRFKEELNSERMSADTLAFYRELYEERVGESALTE